MYLLRLFSLTLAAGILLVCSSEAAAPGSGDPRASQLTGTDSLLVSSSNQFGLRIFKQLAAENQLINVFICPLSISAALAMTYNGSEGDTKSQMKNALGFDSLSDEQVNHAFSNLKTYLTSLDASITMEIANSIWYDTRYTVKDDFISTNRKFYEAETAAIDFARPSAAGEINAWVNSSTRGKIPRIVQPPLDSDMAMLLINAVYFKGVWTYQFAKGLTLNDYFTSQAGAKQQIKMMSQKVSVPYYESRTLQVVDLPYGEGQFAMTIILPAQGGDANSVVVNLTDTGFAKTLASMHVREGTVLLPRFKIEYGKTLKNALRALGIRDAFVPGIADFSRISNDCDFYIDEVKHKTYVEVNEEGTEAAAVTMVGGIRATAVPMSAPFVFRVDRPFVFAIRERASNTILFIGRITDLSS